MLASAIAGLNSNIWIVTQGVKQFFHHFYLFYYTQYYTVYGWSVFTVWCLRLSLMYFYVPAFTAACFLFSPLGGAGLNLWVLFSQHPTQGPPAAADWMALAVSHWSIWLNSLPGTMVPFMHWCASGVGHYLPLAAWSACLVPHPASSGVVRATLPTLPPHWNTRWLAKPYI